MSSPLSRIGRHLIAILLVAIGLFGMAGCGLFTGETPDEGGNTVEENKDLADAVADQIADAIPEATVSINYRDDITVPATVAVTVRVPDAQAATDAVSGEAIPAGTAFDDPARPLAPIAVVAARLVWQSSIDPLRSLSIDVVPSGDAASGDTWNVGVSEGDSAAALTQTFGERP